MLNLDEFHEATGIRLPDGPYETAAGYVLQALGHLPSVGEAVEVDGVRLTVRALDGRRIERLRVSVRARRREADVEPGEAVGRKPFSAGQRLRRAT